MPITHQVCPCSSHGPCRGERDWLCCRHERAGLLRASALFHHTSIGSDKQTYAHAALNPAHLPLTKVIKSMNIAFVKRSTGDITAEAWLTAEQIALLTSTDKGEVTVGNRVTDGKGVEPIKAEMIWAWTPKRR